VGASAAPRPAGAPSAVSQGAQNGPGSGPANGPGGGPAQPDKRAGGRTGVLNGDEHDGVRLAPGSDN